MINASGIISQILSGKLTVHELIRAVDMLEQYSSGTTNYNFVVNVLLAMGVRIVLDDVKVLVAPVNQKTDSTLPAFMRVRKTPALQYIRSEPFMFLPELDSVFARLEIMIHGTELQPTIAAPFREILSLKALMSSRSENVPPMMVAVPVLCLTDGTIRLIRISLYNLVKTPRSVIESGCCIMKGKASRRCVVTPSVSVTYDCNAAEAVANAGPALDQLHTEYAAPNVFTVEQAKTLRNMLDTRQRDAMAIQALMRRVSPAGER
jgi:hypothetical protein